MHQRPALFVPGVGRAGRDAWPHQQALARERVCHYLPRLAPGDPPSTMVEHALGLVDDPAHVVGHSYGAITALHLAAQHPRRVRSLTLIEPAALQVSLASPHTSAHVREMEPVFARAQDPATSDREFSRLFAEASGLPEPDVPDDVLPGLVRHLRATIPPWTLPAHEHVVAEIPTLVVIGDEDTMYAEVARVLGERGATMVVLPGTGHRPHDSPGFEETLRAWWAAHE